MKTKPDEARCDALIKLVRATELAYYCEWCARHILPDDCGVYIHDDVYHPEDISFDGGHHIH